MTTLDQGDFEVRDEGKPQPILLFDNSPQPVRLVVMLDVSGSMEGNLPLLREAAEALFTRLRKDDLARVGSFGADIRIGDTFTRDLRSLRRGAARRHPAGRADPALARARRGHGHVRPRRR